MKPQAVTYLRLSTEEQAAEGVSLDAQQAKAEAWADLNGYEVAGIFTDAGISGTKADRPGLVAALAAVGKGMAIVVYSLSRLSRSTRHMLGTGGIPGKARRLHSAGLSLRKVASVLAEKGLKARNGGTFAASQVRRMVA